MPRISPTARAAAMAAVTAAALLLCASGAALAKGGSGHGGSHGGSHSSGAVGRSNSHHSGRSGALISRSPAFAATHPATTGPFGHAGNCAARDEHGNCVSYGARAPQARYFEPPGGAYTPP